MQKTGSLALLVASLLIVIMAGSGVARADDKDKKGSGDKSAPKVKVYDFSGDTIEGDRILPGGSTVDVYVIGKHASLIRIRSHFIPEIIKSAENL